MVCMGVNTTSGPSLLICRATHGSRALVGPETLAHGMRGSIVSCFSSLISICTVWCPSAATRRASASTMRAAYRLMPSWCSSRV